MVGAGAGDEDAAGAEHLESAEVELLVASKRSIQIALGLGECGRVEDDSIVTAVGGGVVLQEIEGVGLDPFDLAFIESGVLVGDFESRT